MRRIEVTLRFTIDVVGDENGIPNDLQAISWMDVISFGLSEKQWETIDSVHRGQRQLRYLGDPCARGKMKRRRRLRQAEKDFAHHG